MSKRKIGATSPKTNITLVILESMLTSGIISVPFMNILYEMKIGLSHEQIALTQAIFTLASMLLNAPLGWVADRFSRKFANITGDVCCFISLLLYANATSMFDCVLCEILFGVGNAFSQGVDSSLLKHFSDKEDPSNDSKFYKDNYGKMSSLCQLAVFAFYVIGFMVGDMDVRTIIRISAIPSVFAIIASFFIHDDSERITKKDEEEKNSKNNEDPEELEDYSLFGIIKYAIRNPKLNIRIAAYTITREITHGIIWCFTPLLMMAGIEGKWITLGWAANSLAALFGTFLARKFNGKIPEWVAFIAPITLVTIAASAMSIRISVFSLALYTFFGMCQGWTSVMMMPQIQNRAPQKIRCTIESVAKVFSQAFYIVSVWIIGRAADIDLRYAAVATIVLFVPFAIPIVFRLRKQENSEKESAR